MKVLHPLAFALLAASAAAQAQMSKDGMSPMQAPAAGQQAAVMLTDAVVQKIDAAKGVIVLRHGDIPNLAMPARPWASTWPTTRCSTRSSPATRSGFMWRS